MKHHFFHILLTSLLAISWNTESREPARYLYESNSLNSGTGNEEQNGEYQDGTYCAEVEYYYSKTGTNSTYTLNVDIENGELVKIYWPNGGDCRSGPGPAETRRCIPSRSAGAV